MKYVQPNIRWLARCSKAKMDFMTTTFIIFIITIVTIIVPALKIKTSPKNTFWNSVKTSSICIQSRKLAHITTKVTITPKQIKIHDQDYYNHNQFICSLHHLYHNGKHSLYAGGDLHVTPAQPSSLMRSAFSEASSFGSPLIAMFSNS